MLEIENAQRPDEAGTDRRARRREATKAEILEAAWALVREHGLAALSLRDLAARVGMRAPSLYQYFESKHAIYDAMFAQGARQALAELGADLHTSDTGADLRRNAHRMFDFATSEPARAQLLFQRTIPGFEPSPAAYTAAVELYDRVEAMLRSHGIVRPDAMDLWTAIIGGLTSQQLANDPGGTRWARLVDDAVDMFLTHVAPATPAPTRQTSA